MLGYFPDRLRRRFSRASNEPDQEGRWTAPKDHPDFDPPHEALQLLEHYREMVRLPSVQKRSADFKASLTDAENTAREFEAVLRRNAKEKKPDSAIAGKAYQRAHAACLQCHAKYRDAPQEPRAVLVMPFAGLQHHR